jgi:hypothetical protein
MRIKTFQVGETIRLENHPTGGGKGLSGLIVRKIVTQSTRTEIYEVLLSNGRLVAKTAEQLQYVIIRQDGVEINV